MDTDCLAERTTVSFRGASRDAKLIPHPGSTPHAFLMDITHDNESPLSKRTAEDALPTGSLVTFARAAIGSNRGFDDLYPKLLDVVGETRKYEIVKASDGIGEVKRLLNHLHTELVLDEGVEGHFSQEGEVRSPPRLVPTARLSYIHVAVCHGTPRQPGHSQGLPPRRSYRFLRRWRQAQGRGYELLAVLGCSVSLMKHFTYSTHHAP